MRKLPFALLVLVLLVGEAPAQPEPLPPGALLRLGTTRLRQGGSVYRLTFTPDSKTLISSGTGVRFWDVTTGLETRRLHHAGELYALAVSADGSLLVTGAASGDPILRLWDTAPGRELRQFAVGEGIWSAVFSPDGKTVAVGFGGVPRKQGPGEPAKAYHGVELWDVARGERRHTCLGHEGVVSGLAYAPDGKTLASVSWDGAVRLWEADTGKPVRVLRGRQTDWTLSVAFSPDGRWLAQTAGHGPASVRLWDTATGKLVRELAGHVPRGNHGGARAAVFTPDSRTLLSAGEDRTVRFWDVETGKELARLEGAGFPLAVSPDGKWLAAGSSNADSTVRLWDLATRKRVHAPAGHRAAVNTVAYSPDGTRLATGGRDETVRVWGAATGKQLLCFKANQYDVGSVAFSPDGKRLLSANNDVLLWDAATGKALGTVAKAVKAMPPLAVAGSGRPVLVRGGNDTVLWWDLENDKEVRRYAKHPCLVQALAVTADGKTLAAGCNQGGLHLWDVASGRELRTIAQAWPTSLSFSPEGDYLAADEAGQGTACVYRVATGKPYRRLEAEKPLSKVAFSPDGRTAAAVAGADTITLFEVATGKVRLRYTSPQGGIRAIAYAPDGRAVAAAGNDGTVLLWDARGTYADAPDFAKLDIREKDRLWLRLAGADAAEANRIQAAWRSAPVAAVAFLRLRLARTNPPSPRQLANLIEALVDDDPDRRLEANHTLAQMEDLARPELLRTLKATNVPQLRKAVQQLLDKMDTQPLPPGTLQQVRAVESLEQMDTPEARTLLGELALGAPAARQTSEAVAALQRLVKRNPGAR